MARTQRGLLLSSLFMLAIGGAAPAWAQQSCGDDLQKLQQKRQAALQGINDMVAAAKGKQLDPAAFCARSQPLSVVEVQMIAYMEKNKDWCQIPDEVVNQLKDAHAKTVSFSGRACKAAADQKKAQAQGAAGMPQAQPLPAGPL